MLNRTIVNIESLQQFTDHINDYIQDIADKTAVAVLCSGSRCLNFADGTSDYDLVILTDKKYDGNQYAYTIFNISGISSHCYFISFEDIFSSYPHDESYVNRLLHGVFSSKYETIKVYDTQLFSEWQAKCDEAQLSRHSFNSVLCLLHSKIQASDIFQVPESDNRIFGSKIDNLLLCMLCLFGPYQITTETFTMAEWQSMRKLLPRSNKSVTANAEVCAKLSLLIAQLEQYIKDNPAVLTEFSE